MIRLFNVYYPTRTLVLLLCEALLVGGSFLLATACLVGPDSYIALVYENGILKIAGITIFTLLLSYYFDLYEPQRISGRWEIYFRLLLVLSALSFVLAALLYLFPEIEIGPNVLLAGAAILAIVLGLWRSAYEWIIGLSVFRERVYVLGSGERARAVSKRCARAAMPAWKLSPEWAQGGFNGNMERFAADLRAFAKSRTRIDRVIVAMEDRRGSMPVRELLDLRLRGVVIEDASLLMERLTGRLPLNGLNPSALIFTNGFKVKPSQQISGAWSRSLSLLPGWSSACPSFLLSSWPCVSLRRVRSFSARPASDYAGVAFPSSNSEPCGRTPKPMALCGPSKNDTRVTPLGRFMRTTRLDEIPQLWNVLRGEMGFVGPRPERPEFVQWLNREIPFYELRHIVRPGITGWAQVRYNMAPAWRRQSENSNTISTTSSTFRSVSTCSSCLRRSRRSCCEGAPSEIHILVVAHRHSVRVCRLSPRHLAAGAPQAARPSSCSNHPQRQHGSRRP